MQRSVNNASFRCATRCNNKCEGFKYIPGCRNTITVELCVCLFMGQILPSFLYITKNQAI